MPATAPPEGMRPQTAALSAGTRLWRVHSNAYAPESFRTYDGTGDDPWAGGRFDSTNFDQFSYLYAGDSEDAAFGELYFRDRVVAGHQNRVLSAAEVVGRSISTIETAIDLDLVRLYGPGLNAVGQDSWLTGCDGSDYYMTRIWARQIRSVCPGSGGFVWRSRLNDDRLCYVLFGDRVPAGGLKKVGTKWRLDRQVGKARLRRFLDEYRVPHMLGDTSFD